MNLSNEPFVGGGAAVYWFFNKSANDIDLYIELDLPVSKTYRY